MEASECPVCLNGWAIPGNMPMKFGCNHHVCGECLGKLVCEAYPEGKRCPLCRRVSVHATLDYDLPLTTECGLTTNIRDISTKHLEACDSCWMAVSADVDHCVRGNDIKNFTRWVRLGSLPSLELVWWSLLHSQYEIASIWIPHMDITFDMIVCACEGNDTRVAEALVDAYDVSLGCDLRALYTHRADDIVVRLWKRGARDAKLIEPLVKDDNARLLMQVYSPECIIPAAAIFAPGCSQALLDAGHVFDECTVRLYLACRGSMSMSTMRKLLSSGAFVGVGMSAVDMPGLCVDLLRNGFFAAYAWMLEQGIPGAPQHVVDSVYVTQPGDMLRLMLDAGNMPSPRVLADLPDSTLHLVYTYQCSECDALTSRRCSGCNLTRFCSAACRSKGARHTPFCRPKEAPTEMSKIHGFPYTQSGTVFDDLLFEMY